MEIKNNDNDSENIEDVNKNLKDAIHFLVEEGVHNKEFMLNLKAENKMLSNDMIDIRKEIKILKKNSINQLTEIENIRKEMNTKIENIRKEFNLKILTELNVVNDSIKSKLDNSINVVDKTMIKNQLIELKIFKPLDVFIWKIDKFSDKQKQNGVIFSESFYSHRDGYKMWLCMYPCGTDTYRGTHLSIQFQIIDGENDNKLKWPFNNVLKVGIIDQTSSKMFKAFRQECTLSKKQLSPLFNFSNEDLLKYGGIDDDSIIVQCDLLQA